MTSVRPGTMDVAPRVKEVGSDPDVLSPVCANDRIWLADRRAGLEQAEEQRHAAFDALRTRR